jgi:ribosomal protein S12 methylthiotransferase accessory factor
MTAADHAASPIARGEPAALGAATARSAAGRSAADSPPARRELAKGHADGTHRLVPPQATLDRIRPHLARFGITRCADITGLDHLGIPVYVAVRPQGRILQTSNGKGLTHTDARVSALMEGIEHWHAEHPVAAFRRCTLGELRREGVRALSPRGIDGCPARGASVEHLVLDWVLGQELLSGQPAWIPAYAAYYHRDLPYHFSHNGLASGNHPVEATLHALYELIERETLAALSGRRRVHLERCQTMDLATPPSDGVGGLVDQIRRAGLELVVLRAPSPTSLHTVIAVLLDRSPFSGASTVNFGAGAHLSPSVAAIRAITEAAQARLTFIHGSRDDLDARAYERGDAHDALLAYFSARVPDTAWHELDDTASSSLASDLSLVLDAVRVLGAPVAYAADLSQGLAGVSAIKAIVPGLRRPAWI